jgi:hypothetical protein
VSKAAQAKLNTAEAEQDEAIQGYVPEESMARSQQTPDSFESITTAGRGGFLKGKAKQVYSGPERMRATTS